MKTYNTRLLASLAALLVAGTLHAADFEDELKGTWRMVQSDSGIGYVIEELTFDGDGSVLWKGGECGDDKKCSNPDLEPSITFMMVPNPDYPEVSESEMTQAFDMIASDIQFPVIIEKKWSIFNGEHLVVDYNADGEYPEIFKKFD